LFNCRNSVEIRIGNYAKFDWRPYLLKSSCLTCKHEFSLLLDKGRKLCLKLRVCGIGPVRAAVAACKIIEYAH